MGWQDADLYVTSPVGAGPGEVRVILGGPLPAELAAYGYTAMFAQMYYIAGNENRYYYIAPAPNGIDYGFVDLTLGTPVNPIRGDQYLTGVQPFFEFLYARLTAINGVEALTTGGTSGVSEMLLGGQVVSASQDGISNAGAAGTTSSAAYSDIPGTSVVTLSKRSNVSRIRVDMNVSAFVTVGATKLGTGVRVNGTDYDVTPLYYDNAFLRLFIPGTVYVSGLASGSYTVQARWKRISGGGVCTRNTDDWITLTATEVDQ